MAITAVVAYIARQAGMVCQRKMAMRGHHVFVLNRNGGIGVNPFERCLATNQYGTFTSYPSATTGKIRSVKPA